LNRRRGQTSIARVQRSSHASFARWRKLAGFRQKQVPAPQCCGATLRDGTRRNNGPLSAQRRIIVDGFRECVLQESGKAVVQSAPQLNQRGLASRIAAGSEVGETRGAGRTRIHRTSGKGVRQKFLRAAGSFDAKIRPARLRRQWQSAAGRLRNSGTIRAAFAYRQPRRCTHEPAARPSIRYAAHP
jgi:hypothetical protein